MKIFILFFLIIGCKKVDTVLHNDHLRVALSTRLDTIDPALSYDSVSATVLYQVYEQLYQYNYLKRPLAIEPLLAEGMPKVSEDKKTITIKIKKNIKYHQDPSITSKNRYVSAQDFITQIKRLAYIPTRSTGSWLFEGIIKGFNEFKQSVGSNFDLFEKTDIEGLKALDDHTLQIQLTRPFPQLK